MRSVFRKIRFRFAFDNDVTKYLRYAIGEIILVVIGILIALQVNNLNTRRKNHQLECIILQDMSENLKADVSDLQYNIRKDSVIISSIEIILDCINRKLPYCDSLSTYFGNAARLTNFVNNTTAYESLKSMGFGYISNKSLRPAIIRYYDQTVHNTIKVESEILNTFHRNLLEPFMVEHFQYRSMLKPAVPVNFHTLCLDHTYKSLLATKKEYLDWDIKNSRMCIRAASALNDTIQMELPAN